MLAQKLLSVSLVGTEWILYLLIICSVVSWGIMIEKLYFLTKNYKDIEKLKNSAEKVGEQKGLTPVRDLINQNTSSAAYIGKKLLLHAEKHKGDFEEYLMVLLSQERLILDSRLAFLGTIVSIAPFLGLLGTVLGIIKAFHGLSVNKEAGNMVMAGISEALIATALGLFIAIPAVAAYNYSLRLIKKILISSENFSRYLMLRYAFKG